MGWLPSTLPPPSFLLLFALTFLSGYQAPSPSAKCVRESVKSLLDGSQTSERFVAYRMPTRGTEEAEGATYGGYSLPLAPLDEAYHPLLPKDHLDSSQMTEQKNESPNFRKPNQNWKKKLHNLIGANLRRAKLSRTKPEPDFDINSIADESLALRRLMVVGNVKVSKGKLMSEKSLEAWMSTLEKKTGTLLGGNVPLDTHADMRDGLQHLRTRLYERNLDPSSFPYQRMVRIVEGVEGAHSAGLALYHEYLQSEVRTFSISLIEECAPVKLVQEKLRRLGKGVSGEKEGLVMIEVLEAKLKQANQQNDDPTKMAVVSLLTLLLSPGEGHKDDIPWHPAWHAKAHKVLVEEVKATLGEDCTSLPSFYRYLLEPIEPSGAEDFLAYLCLKKIEEKLKRGQSLTVNLISSNMGGLYNH